MNSFEGDYYRENRNTHAGHLTFSLPQTSPELLSTVLLSLSKWFGAQSPSALSVNLLLSARSLQLGFKLLTLPPKKKAANFHYHNSLPSDLSPSFLKGLSVACVHNPSPKS